MDHLNNPEDVLLIIKPKIFKLDLKYQGTKKKKKDFVSFLQKLNNFYFLKKFSLGIPDDCN